MEKLKKIDVSKLEEVKNDLDANFSFGKVEYVDNCIRYNFLLFGRRFVVNLPNVGIDKDFTENSIALAIVKAYNKVKKKGGK